MLVQGLGALRMTEDAVGTQVTAMVPVVDVAHPPDYQIATVTLALEELTVWRKMRSFSLRLDLSEHLVNAVAVNCDAAEASENASGDLGRLEERIG